MAVIQVSMKLRMAFKKEHPNQEVLDGRATYFTSEYVSWLENRLTDAEDRLKKPSEDKEGFEIWQEGEIPKLLGTFMASDFLNAVGSLILKEIKETHTNSIKIVPRESFGYRYFMDGFELFDNKKDATK